MAAPEIEIRDEDAGSEGTDPEMPELIRAERSEALPPGLRVRCLSPRTLSRMSKAERTHYFLRQRAASDPEVPLSAKAERRRLQEAQRCAKGTVRRSLPAPARGDLLGSLAGLKLSGGVDLGAEPGEGGEAGSSEEESSEEEQEEEEEEEDDLALDPQLASGVQVWVDGRDSTGAPLPVEALRDLSSHLRLTCSALATPPMQLQAAVRALTCRTVAAADYERPVRQPGAVAQRAAPRLKRWAAFLDALCSRVGDPQLAAEVCVRGARTGARTGAARRERLADAEVECLQVGFLTSLREQLDSLEDQALLDVCSRVEPQGRVMEAFVRFLTSAVEAAEEEESEEEEEVRERPRGLI